MARIMEAAILIVLPIIFHFLFPVSVIIHRPYSYLGIILMILGFALASWAARVFREAGTTFELHGESSILTVSGPFKISRNPIYLGMVLWLLGLAVLLGSLTAFIFPVLLFLLTNLLIIPIEEKELEKMHGGKYDNYRQSVRRWL